MYKFVYLISSSNFIPLSNLVIYTYKAFQVRDGEVFAADTSVILCLLYKWMLRHLYGNCIVILFLSPQPPTVPSSKPRAALKWCHVEVG